MSVVLAAMAAAGYAATDTTVAALVRRLPGAVVAFWAHVAASLALLGAAVVLAPLPGAGALLASLTAGVVAGVGAVAYYASLGRGPASILAPLAASGLALPVMLGVARGERTAVLAAFGLAVLVAGAALLLLGAQDRSGAAVERGAIALGLLAAVAFGGYFVMVDGAVDAQGGHPLWVAGFVTVGTAAAALPAMLWVSGRAAMRPVREARLGLLAAGAFLVVGDLSLTAAMAAGDVALVAVVASSDPALTVVAARVLLAERVSRRQAAGIALALTGLGGVAAA
jgi:drug/metabolite transporter (DMT)-like permease